MTTSPGFSVEAWELRLQDPAQNANKFYRCYVIDSANVSGQAYGVTQWGPIGAHGQWKVQLFPNQREAINAMLSKDREKTGKGYNRVASPIRFAVEDRVAANPDSAVSRSTLERAYHDASGGAGRVDSEAGERMAAREVKETEDFKATLLKMASKLNPTVEANTGSTNGSPPVQVEVAVDDHESRLAAAMAKAKAARQA